MDTHKNINKTLETILAKDVSRREFLAMIGLSVISVIGLSSLLKNVTKSLTMQSGQVEPPVSSSATAAYGDTTYGGA